MATYTATSSTNYSTMTWSPPGTPGIGDDVDCANYVVTINQNVNLGTNGHFYKGTTGSNGFVMSSGNYSLTGIIYPSLLGAAGPCLSITGAASATIVGHVNGGSAGSGTTSYGINFGSTGVLNIYGDVEGGLKPATSYGIYYNNASGIINIYGSVYSTQIAGGTPAYAIYANVAGKINIAGNIGLPTGPATPLWLTSSTTTSVTGNVYGGSGSSNIYGIRNATGNLTISGSVIAGVGGSNNWGVYNTSTGNITARAVYANTGGYGIYNTQNGTVSAQAVYSNGVLPGLYAAAANTNYTNTMYNILGYPAIIGVTIMPNPVTNKVWVYKGGSGITPYTTSSPYQRTVAFTSIANSSTPNTLTTLTPPFTAIFTNSIGNLSSLSLIPDLSGYWADNGNNQWSLVFSNPIYADAYSVVYNNINTGGGTFSPITYDSSYSGNANTFGNFYNSTGTFPYNTSLPPISSLLTVAGSSTITFYGTHGLANTNVLLLSTFSDPSWNGYFGVNSIPSVSSVVISGPTTSNPTYTTSAPITLPTQNCTSYYANSGLLISSSPLNITNNTTQLLFSNWTDATMSWNGILNTKVIGNYAAIINGPLNSFTGTGNVISLSSMDLLSDNSAAGTLPAQSDVRQNIVYGTGQTGTLIVPALSTVLSGVPIDNTFGTLLVPASGDVRYGTPCIVLTGSSYPSYTVLAGGLRVPLPSFVLSGVATDNTFGTLVVTSSGTNYPALSDVRLNIVYSSGFIGTLAVPALSTVLSGVPVDNTFGKLLMPSLSDVRYGVTSTALTGTSYTSYTLSAGSLRVPSPSLVLSGVPTDNTFGTLLMPSLSDVRFGTRYVNLTGASYTSYATTSGSLIVPALSTVLSGVPIDNTFGKLLMPSLSDIRFGTSSITLTGTSYTSYTLSAGSLRVPALSTVLSGVPVDNAFGTLRVPSLSDIRFGTACIALTGTSYTSYTLSAGRLRVPLPSQVLSGVPTDNTYGTLLTGGGGVSFTVADIWSYPLASVSPNTVGGALKNTTTKADLLTLL